jgi:hypothetical protein
LGRGRGTTGSTAQPDSLAVPGLARSVHAQASPNPCRAARMAIYIYEFLEDSKCDYLTNNVSESFNSYIKKYKVLLIHELVDGLSELIMEKRYLRKKIGKEMEDGIVSNVMKELNTITNNLKVVKVSVSDDDIAEVTLTDNWNNHRRHIVDLQNHKCSCREW